MKTNKLLCEGGTSMLSAFLKRKTPETNLHIGLHKTATTYLQDQLEASLKDHASILYIPRNEYRYLTKQRKKKEFFENISAKTTKIIISDENILGHISSIYGNRNIYVNIEKRIRNIIKEINSEKLNIYISLRNIATFLPSVYCEYLRHCSYISYEDFSENIDIESISWYDIFEKIIKKHKKTNFYIFKFENFNKEKVNLIRKISFGEIESFNATIKKSRQSFTNQEIFDLSDNKIEPKEKEKKFAPYSQEKTKKCLDILDRDIEKLSSLENVTII